MLRARSVEWDTSPVFKPLYSWFLGTMQQWHVALLFIPLILTTKSPEPELERVWAALDCKLVTLHGMYRMLTINASADVFEFDPQLTRSQKMHQAFGISRKRLGELQDLRKTRLPTALEQRLGSSNRQSKAPDRRRSNTLQASASQTRTPSMQDNASLGASYGRAEPSGPGLAGSMIGSQQLSQQQTFDYNSNHSTHGDPDYFQISFDQVPSDVPAIPKPAPVISSQFPNVNWVSQDYFVSIRPLSMLRCVHRHQELSDANMKARTTSKACCLTSSTFLLLISVTCLALTAIYQLRQCLLIPNGINIRRTEIIYQDPHSYYISSKNSSRTSGTSEDSCRLAEYQRLFPTAEAADAVLSARLTTSPIPASSCSSSKA